MGYFFSTLFLSSRCLSTQEKVPRSGIQIKPNHFVCFRHHATTRRYTFANFEPGLPAVQAAQAAQGQLTHGAHGDCELEISHLGEITSRRRAPRVSQHNCERLFSHFSSRGDTSTGATAFLFERSSPSVVVLPPRVQISIK